MWHPSIDLTVIVVSVSYSFCKIQTKTNGPIRFVCTLLRKVKVAIKAACHLLCPSKFRIRLSQDRKYVPALAGRPAFGDLCNLGPVEFSEWFRIAAHLRYNVGIQRLRPTHRLSTACRRRMAGDSFIRPSKSDDSSMNMPRLPNVKPN